MLKDGEINISVGKSDLQASKISKTIGQPYSISSRGDWIYCSQEDR
jgi:hypothetical protein